MHVYFKIMEGKADQIIEIEVGGTTELDLERPMKDVVVRISIVDQTTGQLLRKSAQTNQSGEKSTRQILSPYENTDFVSPVCTKAVEIKDYTELAPEWHDSMLYNLPMEEILRENIVLYFEVIDLSVPINQKHFTAIAWAFLRPKATDGSDNIDKACKLQLHSYPKDFDPNLVGPNLPIATYLNTRKKIPGYLTVEVRTGFPTNPYEIQSRPYNCFGREVGSKDISKLIHQNVDDTEEKGEDEEKPVVQVKQIRPANRSCKIPRQLAAQIPVGEYGAVTLNFNKNGDTLVCAIKNSKSFSLHFFSVYDFRRCLAIIENAHQDTIYEITFTENDDYLMTSSGDGDVKVWQGNGSNQRPKYTFSHPCHVYTAKFHPNDPRLIATGGSDGYLRFWDAPRQKVLKSFRISDGSINSVTFSPDGNSLYAGDSLGIIYTFNTAITANGVDDIAKKTVTKETEITNCAITHLSMERSNYLLAVQTKDSLIRVFETKVMVPSQRYSGITCTDTMMQSTLSPDCEYLVAGSQDGTAKVWAVRKAEIIPTPEWSFKFDGALNAVAWNRVENMIAFSSYAAKMPIIVFKDPTPIANSDDDDLIQF